MNKANIIEVREAIVNLINSSAIECFYRGVRADIAFSLGIAPNNPVFNWVFDNLDYIQNGDGTISAF